LNNKEANIPDPASKQQQINILEYESKSGENTFINHQQNSLSPLKLEARGRAVINNGIFLINSNWRDLRHPVSFFEQMQGMLFSVPLFCDCEEAAPVFNVICKPLKWKQMCFFQLKYTVASFTRSF